MQNKIKKAFHEAATSKRQALSGIVKELSTLNYNILATNNKAVKSLNLGGR